MRLSTGLVRSRGLGCPVLALLLCAAPAFSAGSAPAALRVEVPPSTAALPFLLMQAEHSLEDGDLTIAQFVNHAQALALLLRGDSDLLLSGTSQGWENRLDGSPIVMIDTGIWGISSLVGRDAGIRSMADLRGKRVALPFPGSPLDFQTRALLAHEGLDPDHDVSLSYAPFAQSVPRLLSGQLDAAALPEPLASTVVAKNGLLRLLDYSQAWASFTGGDRQSPQVSLFTTETFARDHRDLLARVVSAWQAATARVIQSPAEMAARFASALSADPGILEQATRNTLFAVPSVQDNKTRVLAYYQTVSRYFPAPAKPLDQGFFVEP